MLFLFRDIYKKLGCDVSHCVRGNLLSLVYQQLCDQKRDSVLKLSRLHTFVANIWMGHSGRSHIERRFSLVRYKVNNTARKLSGGCDWEIRFLMRLLQPYCENKVVFEKGSALHQSGTARESPDTNLPFPKNRKSDTRLDKPMKTVHIMIHVPHPLSTDQANSLLL